MTISEIDGILCILGNITSKQRYCDYFENLYTWGYCPVCNDLIICDFIGSIPSWILSDEYPIEGHFMVEVTDDPYYGCHVNCIFYKHIFMVTYKGISSPSCDFKDIEMQFNQIIPYKSSITDLIINQTILVKEYENNLPYNIDFTNIYNWLKKILSWDNPQKCELVNYLFKKTCKDIAFNIIKFIE